MNEDEIEPDERNSGVPSNKKDALIGLDIAHGFSPKFEEYDPLSFDHSKKQPIYDKSIIINNKLPNLEKTVRSSKDMS